MTVISFRRSRFHLQSQSTSTVNHHHSHHNGGLHDPFNDYQFYTEHSELGAALNRLMSPNQHYASTNAADDTRNPPNESVSIVSAPKNVKFLIPLGRSGLASNESTLGVIESTTRTITHIKDIFPLNASSQNQASTNSEEETVISSSLPNSPERAAATAGLSIDAEQEGLAHDEGIKSDSEEMPLLANGDEDPK